MPIISNRFKAIFPVALMPMLLTAVLACLMVSGRCQSSSRTDAAPLNSEGSAEAASAEHKTAITMSLTTAKAEVSLRLAGTGEAVIDWGDGREEKVALIEASDDVIVNKKVHKYADESYRIINITGENITMLWCQDNELSSLDVGKNTVLVHLDCWGNQLTGLDVSKNVSLTGLNCNNNQLTNLDASKNTALTLLNCANNKLTKLDVSKNTALTELFCFENQLTSLDVSKNTALTQLNCGDNKLTKLDATKNTALTELFCWSNQLTGLDVSKNVALTNLNCNNNQLTKLDVSKNVVLAWLWCNNNQLNAQALDALFGTLHTNSMDGEKTISMFDNPGLSDCDQSIATGRGWEIALEFYD